MPVAIALIFVVVTLAVSLIGILWSLLFLMPFYAFIAVAAYFVWRMKTKAKGHRHVSEAGRQWLFNEQEMKAWRSAVERIEKQRRNEIEFCEASTGRAIHKVRRAEGDQPRSEPKDFFSSSGHDSRDFPA